jgi:hypothetical protein
MAGQLAKWGETAANADPDEDPSGRERLFHRYFEFLSRQGMGHDRLKGRSLESAFVLRLPEAPLGESDTFDTEPKLRERLKDLILELDPKGETPAPATSLELLAEVERLMDFNQWRRSLEPAERDRLEQDPDPVARGVARFVARFRTGR